MHVPDHLMNDPTELIAGATAAAAVAVTVLGARRREPAGSEPEHRRTLLAEPERSSAVVATAGLVFALQMVNFPVLSGTSGHLLGGALATALIGPRRALIALVAVVASQAMFFGDGGVGALGVNLWLIALLPVGVAAAVEHLGRTWAGSRGAACTRLALAGLAALIAPAVASLAFTGFLAAGGPSGAGTAQVAGRMLGVHLAIGLGEAAITLAVLGAVAAVQRFAPGRGSTVGTIWGIALCCGAALSTVASAAPDGR